MPAKVKRRRAEVKGGEDAADAAGSSHPAKRRKVVVNKKAAAGAAPAPAPAKKKKKKTTTKQAATAAGVTRGGAVEGGPAAPAKPSLAAIVNAANAGAEVPTAAAAAAPPTGKQQAKAKAGAKGAPAPATPRSTAPPPKWSFAKGFVVDAYPQGVDTRHISQTLLGDCKKVYHKCSYWMPHGEAPRCVFERFALDVFDLHFPRTGLTAVPPGSGVEWWVQVRGSSQAQGGNSLGFHWDRDEELAVDKGVVVCPAFGTVTYLCDVGAPTVMVGIPPSTQRGSRKIDEMYVSHPQRGKHVVFRGDALHGCPEEFMNKASQAAVRAKYTRVTLLVNLWIGTKPSKIQPLPADIVPTLATSPSLRLLKAPCATAPIPRIPPGSSCPTVGFQFGRKKFEDHEVWLPTPTKKAAAQGTFALAPCPPRSKCVRVSG